ncbi:MAG: hypothetical protein GVY23_08415 [Spirochaetes bacterium]|jgi:hypothetical protein|nr:hypothetical protein [Spirochaetota bacterium]
MSEPVAAGPPALPEIRRARDYHLYDTYGRRYLDFYQNGGRAILSHRPKGLAKRLKGAVDQGLWGAYPSVYSRRLEKVLRGLFPAHPEVRLYASAERAVAAAGGTVVDPALGAGSREEAEASGRAVDGPRAAWWRPSLPAADAELLLPVLPFPASFAPQPVCAVRPGVLPDSDAVSPVPLSGLVQAAHLIASAADALAAAANLDAAGPVPDAAVYPITLVDERDLTLWHRRGPYLQLRCTGERFPGVFAAFLDVGIIINPVFPGPSILPQWCSRGEFEKFVKVSRMADS